MTENIHKTCENYNEKKDMCLKIDTKFGTANLDNGYYRICSRKEGNFNKLLHRLIFEDFYKVDLNKELPNFHVHHVDGNKLNNEIWNLDLMPLADHTRLHKKGIVHSSKTKNKMSESRNTTGYFKVYKEQHKMCKQGYRWKYTYVDEEGKQKAITSVDLQKLKQKVKSKGLIWKEFINGGWIVC